MHDECMDNVSSSVILSYYQEQLLYAVQCHVDYHLSWASERFQKYFL